MSNKRTIQEINEKIKNGSAVVMTAEEVIELVNDKGIEEAFKQIDVVTTATFGPMCSSGAFLNFGHSDPPIRMEEIQLNGVSASGGLAAVDTYIGASSENPDSDGLYGGAHVICDLVGGKSVVLEAKAKGTDCYPQKSVKREIRLSDLNEAFLFNPRNGYQNYSAAINQSSQPIDTYMGTLLPFGKNINYSTSGELSPLLNDPYLKTIGIGTRIFIGGAQGYIAWNGTQFKTDVERFENGIPKNPAATLSVVGDLKNMSTEYLSPVAFKNYGVSMNVGIGIPIPIIDEEILRHCSISNSEIYTNIVDYSVQKLSKPTVKTVSYAHLRTGKIEIDGKEIKTAPLSSLSKARKIANQLKKLIHNGEFLISEPVEYFKMDSSTKAMVKGDDDNDY